MQYGCIGEHLTHSFSGQIHGQLHDYPYELKQLPQDALADFMRKRDFQAINVTIPYKQAVLKYLHGIDSAAAAIGAVNTVVNRKGLLYGYNTDFAGMQDLIRRSGIDLQGKKVLILGTGGTSRTAMAVARAMGAASVWQVSRQQKEDALTYETVLSEHLDGQILINTTPRGMFDRQPGMPIDPGLFPRLSGVIDAVYNPLRTQLVCKARSIGVPAVGGLYMLVRQAVLASEIFLDTHYPPDTTETIYRKLKAQKENIVLIGMPGSGKTTVGKLLAQQLDRPFWDTDALIEEKTGMSPEQIILSRGESAFRDVETQVIDQAAWHTGGIIATGGGAVLRGQNMELLRMNGKIFFLDRPLDQLLPTAQRPLSATREAITQRYRERYEIYIRSADTVIENTGTPHEAAQLVKRSFFP